MEARQQPWPQIWLMTDERMGEGLWPAIGRLPAPAGIVFRHYSLAAEARLELGVRVADLAQNRGLTLAIAGDMELAIRLGAQLTHNPKRLPSPLPFSRSVHSIAEAQRAKADGAAMVFVSPIYQTRSHPNGEILGPLAAVEIARAAAVPAIALGGVDASKFRSLEQKGFYGWAGIDAWM